MPPEARQTRPATADAAIGQHCPGAVGSTLSLASGAWLQVLGSRSLALGAWQAYVIKSKESVPLIDQEEQVMNNINPAATASGQEFAGTSAEDASTTAKVAEAAHHAVDIAVANLTQAEEALRDARRAAGITVSDTAQQAQDAAEDSLDTLREYVQANPLKAVGIAVAAGFITSVLLRK